MSKEIKFTKQSGEIQYRDYLYSRLDSALKTLSNGEYTLSVKKNVKRRSISQNEWFWLAMTCIEKETGTDRNDAHDFFCTKFLRRKVIFNGVEKDVIYGTSKLNTIQFGEFMEKIQAYASQELGILLPNPSDLHYAEFRNEYENR